MDMAAAQSAQPVEFPETSITRKDWSLSLHQETTYMLGISISKGIPSKIKLRIEDLGLAPEVIEALESAGAISPKVPIFEAFNKLHNKLDASRKKAQKLMVCSNNIWFLPVSRLVEFNQYMSDMEADAKQFRAEAIAGHPAGLLEYKESVGEILKRVGVSDEDFDALLAHYLEQFPSIDQLEYALEVGLHWYGELQPISETIKSDLQLQIELARTKKESAIAAQEESAAIKAQQRLALLEMQKRAMADQEKRLAELDKDVAAEIQSILEVQYRQIAKIAQGANVTETIHNKCIQATERLGTLVNLVQASKRASIQADVDRVLTQVNEALHAPRGAYQSETLEAELYSLKMAIQQKDAHPERLAQLKGRVAILRDVLNHKTDELEAAIAALETKQPVHDDIAGF